MAELSMPKLNNNDTDYVLTAWLVEDGEAVTEGQPVAEVETSKASQEVEAESAGTFRRLVREGARCLPGEVIAELVAEGAQPALPRPAGPTASVASHASAASAARGAGGPPVTRPAQELADRLGVTAGQLATLDVAVVRTEDVQALADAQAGSPGPAPDVPAPAAEERPGVPLTRVQQAVARAVELSHRTVPAAYTVVRMDLGPVLTRARELTREVRRPVGLAELFVQRVAALHADFPRFFSSIDGTIAIPAEAPHIGVTVDLGEGLYVPCLHDAANLTLREIATRLTAYRIAATKGGFDERDLTGANFVITLHTDGDVVLAIPFVFPGTACALAVTAPSDGTQAHIGLAYDHRLINGRDAALFLKALKNSVEGLV
ncbi:2-oxo acid dehydrogenase subunit E2 [Streptomyces sp. NPDC002734]|uniref:2-oxo acid dehydrogenase subunit E2 n=1 Tax=Streptomyces sp. NPDC002734 TaxID=3154426 RepID=UPI003322D446